MRNLGILICMVAVLAMGMSVLAGDAAPKHEYIGAKKCKMCHKKDGTHPSWAESKHATVWEGLSDADKANADLQKYYTTGTNKAGELLTGIQCEVCHGPGSDYKKKKVMSDREASVAAGLLFPTAETCMGCHNDKAPAALAAIGKDFDFAKAVAKGVHAMPAKEEAEAKK